MNLPAPLCLESGDGGVLMAERLGGEVEVRASSKSTDNLAADISQRGQLQQQNHAIEQTWTMTAGNYD